MDTKKFTQLLESNETLERLAVYSRCQRALREPAFAVEFLKVATAEELVMLSAVMASVGKVEFMKHGQSLANSGTERNETESISTTASNEGTSHSFTDDATTDTGCGALVITEHDTPSLAESTKQGNWSRAVESTLVRLRPEELADKVCELRDIVLALEVSSACRWKHMVVIANVVTKCLMAHCSGSASAGEKDHVLQTFGFVDITHFNQWQDSLAMLTERSQLPVRAIVVFRKLLSITSKMLHSDFGVSDKYLADEQSFHDSLTAMHLAHS